MLSNRRCRKDAMYSPSRSKARSIALNVSLSTAISSRPMAKTLVLRCSSRHSPSSKFVARILRRSQAGICRAHRHRRFECTRAPGREGVARPCPWRTGATAGKGSRLFREPAHAPCPRLCGALPSPRTRVCGSPYTAVRPSPWRVLTVEPRFTLDPVASDPGGRQDASGSARIPCGTPLHWRTPRSPHPDLEGKP